MDFKFDFLVEPQEDQKSDQSSIETKSNISRPAQRILISKVSKRTGATESITVAKEKLKKYRNPIENKTSNEVIDIARALDLKSGVYEGGFKLWECAIDLIEFLLNQGIDSLKGKRVMELGCGHGLPAIVCLKHGAIVDFQDYNSEVIESLTIPTALLNSSQQDVEERARFFSGDWDSDLLGSNSELQYDIILTSDTIYNVQYYSKLYNFFKSHLKEDGVVYVAAKTFYFGKENELQRDIKGVGGSVAHFKKVMEEGGIFVVSELLHIEDGSSNIRDILSVSRRKESK